MKDIFWCCLTLIICAFMLCITIKQSGQYGNLDEGEIEAIEYIRDKANELNLTAGEYIQAVKEYEEEQIEQYEYFEKVDNGTNTRVDDLKAERNGWISFEEQD